MTLLLLASALVSAASLLAWVYLALARGQFWRTDQRLRVDQESGVRGKPTSVSIIIPARNEADILPHTLPSLLRQDYAGRFHIFLVDDHSADGTADAARQLACDASAEARLTVLEAAPLRPGWTGKLWALQQGIEASKSAGSEFLLLTDADIAHPPDSLSALVRRAQAQELDLVSLMARLRVKTFWERMLVPAFVFFFAKLYPFRWANDPRRPIAAAAGGCLLVRRSALERSGGLEPIASELIDDCALAARIKRRARPRGGRIWLGLTQDVRSLRAYDGLGPIWSMVARSAYAQLRYSPLLLVFTVAGMLFLYLVPPAAGLGGLIALLAGQEPGLSGWLAATGLTAWTLMAGCYVPMLRWHKASLLFAPLLPITAMLYTLMTVDSALRWWRGKGNSWKGRTYRGVGAKD